MNPLAKADQRAPSNHIRIRTHSKVTDSSMSSNPRPTPRPQSDFPGVAFSPAPRRPQRRAIKRLLFRALRKLKKYLDQKAAKYNTEQQSGGLTRASRPRSRSRTSRRSRQYPTSTNRANPVTSHGIQKWSRPLSGAPPSLRQDASTMTLDAKGPFSASQKRELSRKLTTIRESSAEPEGNGADSVRLQSVSTLSYGDVDVESDPMNHGPTTPIPEPSELSEHFPNLTCRRCNVDWARADGFAMNDFILLQNTEAMKALSRDAAVILRAEGWWIQRCDTFDDSAWREGSIRRSLASLLNVRRWYRHHRTTSGQSVPSLSSSHSSQGSIVESFPTPANPAQTLYEDHYIEHHRNSQSSRLNDSPVTTPVITVSEWDEAGSIYNAALTSHPGASRITSADAPVSGAQLRANYSFSPLKPMARLRGKQPWYLNEFSSPFGPTPLLSVETLPVPAQPVDFFMERPLMIPTAASMHA